MKKTTNEIILFENQKVKLEVNMRDDTVWLNTEQMATLFGRDRTVITRHINNIFKSQELSKKEVCAKFAHTTEHGALKDRTQTRELDFYNLDMIISVGYRVNSKQGIIFRKWATKVLKDYMIKGYAVNQKRLEYLEKTIRLIDIANRIDDELENDQAREILRVIGDYSKALNLLDDYDHRTLKNIKGTKDQKKITYEDCMKLIKKLRFNEESDLFAIERNNGLASIINNIYQTFDGKEVYQSVEEKAVNFLYLIVKDHIFIDGNKRIAATLFIYFLNFYQILYKGDKQLIDNNTLTALTLLIAQSNPKEKDILVDLVMNFLN
ncbi:MAG TPA: virulence protein RhuM/Fic/DOC family protein [Candidatus Pelethosoma merdigallinarum]|nr:virulence protein RhuM/Fic/DOC family protein [Candidatus Pelethosoma merdigallinarum]